MEDINFKPIARLYCDFESKFGTPRQSGMINGVEGRIVFEPEFRNDDALRGIDGYSHLWLIWHFSLAEQDAWSPTVRPPRLGGNARMGVFATRSPYRPNPIGLSCVELLRIEKTKEKGSVIVVKGADLVSGTPILDIKPYLVYADCKADAVCGFADKLGDKRLAVEIPERLLKIIPKGKGNALKEVISLDPRPGYHDDEGREYRFEFAGMNICFKVENGVAFVININGI